MPEAQKDENYRGDTQGRVLPCPKAGGPPGQCEPAGCTGGPRGCLPSSGMSGSCDSQQPDSPEACREAEPALVRPTCPPHALDGILLNVNLQVSISRVSESSRTTNCAYTLPGTVLRADITEGSRHVLLYHGADM